jgi:hypothetical protein
MCSFVLRRLPTARGALVDAVHVIGVGRGELGGEAESSEACWVISAASALVGSSTAACSCSPSSTAACKNSSTSGFELASPLSPLSPLSAAVVSVVSPLSLPSSSELQAAAVPAKSRPTSMRPRNLRMEGDPSVIFRPPRIG